MGGIGERREHGEDVRERVGDDGVEESETGRVEEVRVQGGLVRGGQGGGRGDGEMIRQTAKRTKKKRDDQYAVRCMVDLNSIEM